MAQIPDTYVAQPNTLRLYRRSGSEARDRGEASGSHGVRVNVLITSMVLAVLVDRERTLRQSVGSTGQLQVGTLPSHGTDPDIYVAQPNTLRLYGSEARDRGEARGT